MPNENFLPNLSVDCVIFGFFSGRLNVLAVQMKGDSGPWGLPGGFVLRKEPLDNAAHRVLTERTGLEDIFLRQFYVFGSLDRDNEVIIHQLHRHNLIDDAMLNFLDNRFVSVAYYALVKHQKADITQSILTRDIQWFDVNDLPPLMLDHGEMVERALRQLRSELNNQPVGLNLLPEKFTMTELQQLYEAILGKALDRRNFSRKILRFGILRKLNERRTGVAHKSPQLYSFDKIPYGKALEEGFSQLW